MRARRGASGGGVGINEGTGDGEEEGVGDV